MMICSCLSCRSRSSPRSSSSSGRQPYFRTSSFPYRPALTCMLPRHSRTHPFVMRIRSFAWTRSISSFQRLTETSVPSSSTAFASATFPVEPLRLEKSRASPFCRIVSSMTSTLLSGRSSLTFMRPGPPTSAFRLNISAGGRDGKHGEGVIQSSSGKGGRSAVFLLVGEILSDTEIKLITARPDIERVDFFESHQGCERGRRTGSDSPRSRYGGQERSVQGSLRGLEDGPGGRGGVRRARFRRPPGLREDE